MIQVNLIALINSRGIGKREPLNPLQQFGFAEVVSYTLYLAQGVKLHEPQSYEEAIKGLDST